MFSAELNFSSFLEQFQILLIKIKTRRHMLQKQVGDTAPDKIQDYFRNVHLLTKIMFTYENTKVPNVE